MLDERFNRLPASGRALVKTLLDIVEQILSGRCDEEEMEEISRRVNPDMKGYKCEDDYVTIDEGMRIMHYNRNRNGFCNLMKKYGIENETFNNIKIGYSRAQIVALKHKLDEDYRRRKARENTMRMRSAEYGDVFKDKNGTVND